MIGKLHPLYFLGFILLILVNIIWKNSEIENKIAQEYAERADTEMMAKRIVELKKVMNAPEKTRIDKMLNAAQFSGADLSHQIKNGHYIIDAKSLDGRQLQTLLNYVLNMSVNVTQLKIERKDDKQASLYMEISL